MASLIFLDSHIVLPLLNLFELRAGFLISGQLPKAELVQFVPVYSPLLKCLNVENCGETFPISLSTHNLFRSPQVS